jgi:hypothetical protein
MKFDVVTATDWFVSQVLIGRCQRHSHWWDWICVPALLLDFPWKHWYSFPQHRTYRWKLSTKSSESGLWRASMDAMMLPEKCRLIRYQSKYGSSVLNCLFSAWYPQKMSGSVRNNFDKRNILSSYKTWKPLWTC